MVPPRDFRLEAAQAILRQLRHQQQPTPVEIYRKCPASLFPDGPS
jgi:hypothetical protein